MDITLGTLSKHGRDNTYKFWLENQMGRAYLGELGVDGRIILKWILNNVQSFGLD
jgi:hypothetical protein